MILANKKLVLVIVIMMLFFIGFFNGFSQEKGNTVQKALNTSPGKKLDVDLKYGGAIHISGWDKNQVSITARFENGDINLWNIDLKETGEGVSLRTDYSGEKHKIHGPSSFEIQVPSKYNLELRTAGGGISIAGVEGKITGKTMGGELKLSRLKGFIDLKTMGGEISLTDSDIDGKVSTMGGRVMLENVVGDIDGSSMGGNVIYKNVKTRSGNSTGKEVNIRTMGGAIDVNDASHGAKVSTMGGDIHIASAREYVTAKTMGGKIVVDSIDGWIEATTMGGDIRVTMTGDPNKGKRDVTLTSMGGDITLNVPAGLSMDIDLKLSFTEKYSKKCKITGSMNIKQETTDKWETDKGTPRKTISGTAKTKDGKNKIIIKTINGNIDIKEI
jgi:DUF4097 and DUF4098 domain-containing protein YvlB